MFFRYAKKKHYMETVPTRQKAPPWKRFQKRPKTPPDSPFLYYAKKNENMPKNHRTYELKVSIMRSKKTPKKTNFKIAQSFKV